MNNKLERIWKEAVVAYSTYNQGICLKGLRESIVAYGPVTEQWLCKQRPLLGNACNIHASSNRTVCSVVRSADISGQRLGKHVPAVMDTNATIEERCFLCGPCRDVITRTVWAFSSVDNSVVSSISQRPTAWAEKLKNFHCWELLPSND
jgi:hypothetical protein